MPLSSLVVDAQSFVREHTLTRLELYPFDSVHNTAVFNPSASVWQLVEDHVRCYDGSTASRLVHLVNLTGSHTSVYLKSAEPDFPEISLIRLLKLAPSLCFMHLVRGVVDEEYPTAILPATPVIT